MGPKVLSANGIQGRWNARTEKTENPRARGGNSESANENLESFLHVTIICKSWVIRQYIHGASTDIVSVERSMCGTSVSSISQFAFNILVWIIYKCNKRKCVGGNALRHGWVRTDPSPSPEFEPESSMEMLHKLWASGKWDVCYCGENSMHAYLYVACLQLSLWCLCLQMCKCIRSSVVFVCLLAWNLL